MEAMLQNLTKSGMTDIAFLIVNSKKERSQSKFHLLEEIVSFPVYQETSDEEIWSVLGGGKDDMFVYDRCGRLVAYIPFPLSILDTDRSLVFNFVLYAYHIDPCDEIAPCREMDDESLQDYGNHTRSQISTDGENYEEANITRKSNELTPEDSESWFGNNDTTDFDSRSKDFHMMNHSSENISNVEAQNYNASESIYNSTWETQITSNFSTFNVSGSSVGQGPENEIICSDPDSCYPDKRIHTNTNDTKPKVKDATEASTKRICADEYEKICEQWSKVQLKRIQKCCAHIVHNAGDAVNSRGESMCEFFNKKRCKKLRTVIKCCLKTQVSDEDGENVEEEEVSKKQEITDSPETKSHDHSDMHGQDAMKKVL